MNQITSSVSRFAWSRTLRTRRYLAALGAGTLLLSACGGGSDSSSTTTTVVQTTLPLVTTTTVAVATPTSIVYVTEGAIVGVANASRVNGAAGRMTERLAEVGFQTGTPTNYPSGQLETTVIYFVPGDPAAQAVAASVRDALGGGSITLAEVPTPAPTDTGELGNITVLVAMGNDVADKSLAELQTGTTAPSTGSTGGGSTSTGGTGTDSGTATGDATSTETTTTTTTTTVPG